MKLFCEKLPQKSSVVDTRPNSEVAAKRCSIIKVFSEISRNSSEFYIRLTSYVSAYNFHFTLFHEITYLATLTLLKSNICLSTSERKPIPFVETQTVYN